MAEASWRIPRKWDLPAAFLFLLITFLILKLNQFRSFQTLFEPADYELVLWNTLHGHFLQLPGVSASFFSEHFSPVLLIILPIYALFQSPYSLIALQSLVCAAAVVPLYFLVGRFTPLRWPPLALTLAFGVSSIVTNGLMYDFHPETLYPLLFFTAFLSFEKKNWPPFFLCLALALTVKEDASVAVGGLGLWMFFMGERKRGIVTVLAGLVGVLLVVLVIIPLFRGESIGHEYKFAMHWSGYGHSQKEILLNLFNPVREIQVLFTASKLQRMNILFSGFLFLPFFSFRGIAFLVLPCWFMLYSSDYWLMNGPFLYYGMLILPFLFYSALLGIETLCRQWTSRRSLILLLTSTLILLVQLSHTTLIRQLVDTDWHPSPRYTTTANEIIASLPIGAEVAAQSPLVPHIPPSMQRTCFPFHVDQANYIFLDLRGNTWPFSASAFAARVDSLKGNPDWVVRFEKDDFLLLQRRK